VAMTAHAMKGDRERCLEAGMDGYVAKPIQAAELFAALEGISAAPANVPQALEPVEAGLVDWAAALKQVGGDAELLRDLLGVFLEELPRWLAALHEAVAEGNAATVRQLAHTVKGSLGQFGTGKAYEAATRLETLGHDGTLADADAALAGLERECSLVLPMLSAYAKTSDTRS
jgi:two-component system sensor histidine kinase/response regulator